MKGKKEAEEGARKEKKRIGRREGERKCGRCEKKKREIFERGLKNVKGERKEREREYGRYKGTQKGRGCIRRKPIAKSGRVKAVQEKCKEKGGLVKADGERQFGGAGRVKGFWKMGF